MSVIAGIFRLSGPPVDPADTSLKLDRLSSYRPDGEGMWCRGHTGPGHRMLYTTPESLHEKLPLFDRTAESAITADARLDNRRDLIRALERKAVPGREVTDSELILAACRRWRESCVETLPGDFAFVIWWLQESGLTPAIAAELSASSTVPVAACRDERVPNGRQNSP